jgi:predicted XRE-type DNA-binding protein
MVKEEEPQGLVKLLKYFYTAFRTMSNKINETIGKNLICLRVRLGENHGGMKQSEFCHLLGIDQSQYSKYEKGKSAITVEKLYDLAEKIGIDPQEILKNRDVPFLPGFESLDKLRRTKIG